jgi:YjbE family integral membrane protein
VFEGTFTDVGAFVGVVLIDLALSADNAVAVGLAAAALDPARRRKAIFWGVLLALILRIAFGLVTVQLLHIRGAMLFGGLTLFWIAWRMWEDLKAHSEAQAGGQTASAATRPQPSFMRALISIVFANIAFSLDNVLAVAGVARNSPWIMTFGLVLSVLLMGVAASIIAGLIDRHRWIGYLGLAVIVVAAGTMIWDDLSEFLPAYVPPPPLWLGGHLRAPG